MKKPKKVRMLMDVQSEFPFQPVIRAKKGAELGVEVNSHGAVSAKIGGHLLGLKPHEFEVIEYEPEPDQLQEIAESLSKAEPVALEFRDDRAVGTFELVLPKFVYGWSINTLRDWIRSLTVPSDRQLDIDGLVAAIKAMKELKDKEVMRVEVQKNFYLKRCDLLQKFQKGMRDPERTLICDILANGTLLPDDGVRYGDILKKAKE
jgi:hypothetical protein